MIDDFRFGKKRQGDFALLQQAGEQFGFTCEQMPTRLLNNERVSSTRVRIDQLKALICCSKISCNILIPAFGSSVLYQWIFKEHR